MAKEDNRDFNEIMGETVPSHIEYLEKNNFSKRLSGFMEMVKEFWPNLVPSKYRKNGEDNADAA